MICLHSRPASMKRTKSKSKSPAHAPKNPPPPPPMHKTVSVDTALSDKVLYDVGLLRTLDVFFDTCSVHFIDVIDAHCPCSTVPYVLTHSL